MEIALETALYGEESSLELTRGDGRGCEAIITIPLTINCRSRLRGILRFYERTAVQLFSPIRVSNNTGDACVFNSSDYA